MLAIAIIVGGGYVVWDRVLSKDPTTSDATTVAASTKPTLQAPTVAIGTPLSTTADTATAEPTPTEDINAVALEELQAWRSDSLAMTSLDGRWVLQLASKYPGVVDDTQVAESGGSTFFAADIRTQFRGIETEMASRGIPVLQVLDSDFGTKHSERSGTIWTLLADPGGLDDRAAAEAACADLFPQLNSDALRNSCLPRRLIAP